MKNSFKEIVCLTISVAMLIVCSSCTSLPKILGRGYFTHVVKWQGESFSIIANWYTGDAQNWKVLAEANQDINPNRLHEGMKVRIPENIMKTKAALTKEYVDNYYPKPKKPPTKSGPTHAKDKDDEPILFGPKEYPGK